MFFNKFIPIALLVLLFESFHVKPTNSYNLRGDEENDIHHIREKNTDTERKTSIHFVPPPVEKMKNLFVDSFDDMTKMTPPKPFSIKGLNMKKIYEALLPNDIPASVFDLKAVRGKQSCKNGRARVSPFLGFFCKDVDLMSFIPVCDFQTSEGNKATKLNDIWGWEDSSGTECKSTSTDILAISYGFNNLLRFWLTSFSSLSLYYLSVHQRGYSRSGYGNSIRFAGRS